MLYLILLTMLADPPSIAWTSFPSGEIVAVECAGDVNSDDTDDIFAASAESSGYGIMCLSGITGDVIWLNDSIGGAFATGCLRATGDADLDGVNDLAVATESSNAISLLSGATGDIIWTAPQSNPVVFIQHSQGSLPGDVVVLGSRVSPGSYATFFALDGQTGSFMWSTPSYATLDSWIKVTDLDVTGNGWSEMGFSVDRGSVFTGWVSARDGYTGDIIQSCGTTYFGTMDICDSPIACIAVSHFGTYPVMWMNHLTTGTGIWSSDDGNLSFTNLCFSPNVTGPSSPYPEVVGWYGSSMTLVRGDDGYYQDSYQFPGDIQAFEFFLDDSVCRLALATSTNLYCPDLVFSSPSTGPSIALPNSGGCDLCLLESDLYPTPPVAVAMNSPGWGVCAINTSWPVGNQEQVTAPVTTLLRLLSNPGVGGIMLQIDEVPLNASVVDITGRIIERIRQTEPGVLFVSLPAGVYHVIEQGFSCPALRAVVLP